MSGQACAHISPLQSELAEGGAAPQSRILVFLLGLAHSAPHCRTARALLRSSLAALADGIREHLPEASWTSDPLKAANVDDRKPGVRRTHDEAFKEAVVDRAVKERRANSEGMYLRSLGEVNANSAQQWSEKALLRYQSSCWLGASRVQLVSVALDASRLGNPAEDVIVFAAWCEGPLQRFGCWLPPQVIPDVKKDPPKGSKHFQPVSQEELVTERERLQNFMGTLTARTDGQKASAKSTELPRVANQHQMLAYDNALMSGLGLNMMYFIHERPPRRLLPWEERYFVPNDSVPNSFNGFASDPPDRTRCCVCNSRTGERWIEVPHVTNPDGSLHSPCLHSSSDKGSVGWPGLQWLYNRQHVRGCLLPDPLHQDWNGLKASCAACGMWALVLERIIVRNLPSGPSQGARFFNSLKEHGERFFQTCGPQNEWFLTLFERVSRDLGIEPSDFLSERHVQEVWAACAESPVLRRKGRKVRAGRWYQLFAEENEHEGEAMVMLLILCYMGQRENFWGSFDASPLASNGRAGLGGEPVENPAAGGAASSNPGPVRSTVAQSNREVEEMRGKSKNSCDLVVRILAKDFGRRAFEALRYAMAPFHRTFGMWQHEMKTIMGTENLLIEWASGKYGSEISEALERLEGGPGFARLGFSDCDADDMVDSLVEEDELMAQKLFSVTVVLAGNRCMNLMMWSHMLPGRFVFLLHREPGVVSATLAWLKQVWQKLQDAERLAHSNSYLDTFVRELSFPEWVFCREIFILLEEAKFMTVLGEVRERVSQLARSFVSTNIVEESFNELQSRQNSNKRKEIGRKARWAALRSSPLLSDYDRKMPARTPASDMAAAKSLPNSMFEARLADYCQGAEELMTISTAKGWTHLSPEAWNALPFQFQRFLQVSPDVKALKSSWMSLMLQEGFALKHSEWTDARLVLKVTAWGLMLWPLNHDKAARVFSPSLNVVDGAPIEYHVISEPEKYHVIPMKAVPQCTHKKHFPRAKGPMVGIKLKFDDGAYPLLTFSAKRCVRGLNAPHLRDLHSRLIGGPASERPTTERELLKALVGKVLTKARDEDIEKILASRAKPSQGESEMISSVLDDPAVDDALKDCVDEGDVEEFKRVVEMKRKAVAKASLPAASSGGASSSSAPASAAAKTRPKKFPNAKSCTPAWARQFVPQVRGATIVIDEVRHLRWVAEYKDQKEPPRSHSATFGDESVVSRQQALLKALRWQWAVHEAETGETCPWDLSE